MRTIKLKQLSPEFCQKYGGYVNLLENLTTSQDGPVAFHPDKVVQTISSHMVGMSLLEVRPRPLVVDETEYHNYTSESMLPIDCDMITHVAPAAPGGQPKPDDFEAYLIPKGTLLTIRPGVWHHATYTLPGESGHCLIVLPERTYTNDCVCMTLPQDDQIKIEL